MVDQLAIDRIRVQKESPDVETPGLLVKALISSYFMMSDDFIHPDRRQVFLTKITVRTKKSYTTNWVFFPRLLINVLSPPSLPVQTSSAFEYVPEKN